MNAIKIAVIGLIITLCPVVAQAGLELVMNTGDKIIATTATGTIEIEAKEGLNRSYTWEGSTRSAKLLPRTERWYGSMGAYYPGPGEHWKSNNGITRGVLQEGQQHFETLEAARKWLDQQCKIYSTVFTHSGLVVSFEKVPDRRQLNVEVWQILIKGKPPQRIEKSNDSKIKLERFKKL
jgi:hypothetical protein